MDILNGNTFRQALELCDSFSDANIGIIRLHNRSFHWVLYEEGVNEDALPIIASVERLLLPYEELKDSEELDDFLNSFKIVTPVVKPLCNV